MKSSSTEGLVARDVASAVGGAPSGPGAGGPASRAPRVEAPAEILFRAQSGFDLDPVYGPESLAGFDPAEQLGAPGEFPFTRGVYPNMYRVRPWTIREYAGFGSASETNRRFRNLIEEGETGLSVAFDLPTQMGYDSDHPLARGEVGKVGVATIRWPTCGRCSTGSASIRSRRP
jgi:methylmalonyl-CoA mutase N-terminal domain/subunit